MVTTDVVIVGGGIIGCSLAYALRKRGIGVGICDQGDRGAQASGAASGLLAPLKPFAQPEDPYTLLLLSSLARMASFITEVETISGICTGYVQTGSVRVRPAKQTPRLQKWVETWQQAGFPLLEVLREDELQTQEPALATKNQIALYNPYEPQLDAPQFMRAVARTAETLGAVFYLNDAVVALHTSGKRVNGVQTSQGNTIRCNHLVLASGAWAAQGGEWLGLTLPVRPLRAQSLTLHQPALPLQHMLFGEGIYLAPKENGTLLIG